MEVSWDKDGEDKKVSAGSKEEVTNTTFNRTSCFNTKHGVPILTFDHSVDNFLTTMDAISELSGGKEVENFEASEIERFKAMIVFLREWKQFFFCEWMPYPYKSKTVNFTYPTESTEEKHAINGIELPHFSSAAVPKITEESPCSSSAFHNDDFLLHVGGSVWTLDWCPRLHENAAGNVNCEYLAIAAHPNGSEYHKIGERLSGRGFIQIWCFAHLGDKEELLNFGIQPCIGKGNKKIKNSCVPKPRGRPRKIPVSIPNASNGASNSDVVEGSWAPSSQQAMGTTNGYYMSSGFYRTEEPHKSYNADNLNSYLIEGPRKRRGRPRKNSFAKLPKPSERPREHTLPTSNGCEVTQGMSDLKRGEILPSSDTSTHDDYPLLQVRDSEDNVLLNHADNLNGYLIEGPRKRRGRPRKNPVAKLPKPRERPGEHTIPSSNGCEVTQGVSDLKRGEILPSSDTSTREDFPLLQVRDSEDSVLLNRAGNLNGYLIEGPRKRRGRPRKNPVAKLPKPKARLRKHTIPSSNGCEVTQGVSDLKRGEILPSGDTSTHEDYSLLQVRNLEDSVLLNHANNCQEIIAVIEESVQEKSSILEGISLPRLVFSLVHNGKVAWDMKWRPSDAVDSNDKHHLGYLAVVLGDGSLEVWEVPVHNLVKHLYVSHQTEGTDPRFLKLQPVFRCSRINFGVRQCIPLALEWSPSASRDLILVGCHDGTVALWKFSSQLPPQDTRPLLCFTADAVPIRSLAWAPEDSDSECSNLIVTAGHEGLKFWDLRDPYHPLWDFSPVHRAVLGLDWLKNPRCIVIAYEDGTMRTLSLTRIANDTPVTGEPLARTRHQGAHCQTCSMFALWSIQVSRSSGLAAYCSSDGCTRYFQLTSEYVDKDAGRYRRPHFLCGSFADDGQALEVKTPSPSTPLPKQPFVSKKANNEAMLTDSSIQALCWHDGEDTGKNGGEEKRVKECKNFASFPPKSVAIHKVRWNMNEGSGRWLCYGGASGIVRCQVISP